VARVTLRLIGDRHVKLLTAVTGALLTVVGTFVLIGAAIEAGQAAADAGTYELYCSDTPVGNVAFNDVVTTGTMSPANPVGGSQFSLTNYQTKIPVPQSVVDLTP